MATRAFSQAVTDETLMRSPLRHAPFPFSAIKHSRSSGALTMPSTISPVQAVGHGRDGQGQAVGKIGCAVHGIDDPAGIRQAQSFRALFSEESGLGHQGCKAFFQECLHSDIGFRYEIDAPLMADSVGMGMIGADDGAAFLDDGKGLQGQW
mgnify:CR=1 FL=1